MSDHPLSPDQPERALPKFPPRPAAPVAAPAVIVSTLPDELPWATKTQVTALPMPSVTAEPATVTMPVAPAEPSPPRRRPRWLPLAAVTAALAVVVGVILWATTGNDDPPPVRPPAPATEFLFQRMGETVEPMRDSDCSEHAYGKVKEFFVTAPCRQLSRAVFVTSLDSGQTVYTSVSVVRMPDRDSAEKLEMLIRQDDTGSVNDLLREKKVTVPGLSRLSQGGFSATTNDRDVVIAEADSPDRGDDPTAHKADMKRVSVDALRLGKELD
ncbi:hypothetical protein [Actinokineospora inagensis]|uniref:hypothetical protein n=1 Tax=Actinokineospora inagensis TaxID=103730 RepID=UPI0012FCB3B9|nr:hypothetical protein [Actinokineospora inagensis]